MRDFDVTPETNEETTTTVTAEAPGVEEEAAPAEAEPVAISDHPENAALGFLIVVHGDGIEAELVDAVGKLRARLEHTADHWRNQSGRRSPELLKAFVALSAAYIRRRRGLEDRLERVRLMLGLDAPPPEGAQVAEEVRDLVALVWGAEGAAVLRDVQAELEKRIRDRIAKTTGKLEALLDPRRCYRECNNKEADRVCGLPNDPDVMLHHEPALAEAAKLLDARRADENLLARLTQDLSFAAQACRDACAAAIAAAGGPEVITRALREQRLVQRQWFQADDAYSALAAADADLQTANEQANALGVDSTIKPEQGTYAAQVVAKATEAAAKVTALKAEIDERRKADTLELVKLAQTGDESARAEVAASAAKLRAAFPAGFPDAIHLAQFEGSQFGALVDELAASDVD